MTPKEIDVLWITGGLSCDGDSVAITTATRPSLEDVLLAPVPWLPKVNLHHPLRTFESRDAFLAPFSSAARGEPERPFILVVEGSIPNDDVEAEGAWAAFGKDPRTGQPITTRQWIDRLARGAFAVVAIGTCASYGGAPPLSEKPGGAKGLPDYLGADFRSAASIPVICVPGCPAQPDTFMETLLYLLHHAAGAAPRIPLDDALRPRWLFARELESTCSVKRGRTDPTAPGAATVATSSLGQLLPMDSLVRKRASNTMHDDANCDLCSEAAGPAHPHLVDSETNAIACVCGPCASTGGGARWRRVPEGAERVASR